MTLSGYSIAKTTVRATSSGRIAISFILAAVWFLISELDGAGASSKSFIVADSGSRVASLKDGEVLFIHAEPPGANEAHSKMDKSVISGPGIDPTGNAVSYNAYYSGGSACGMNCPSPYNPRGGFDGLAVLTAQRNQERWQDTMFWNLSDGQFVGIEPPTGWGPYQSNLNRISHNAAYNRGSYGSGKRVETPVVRQVPTLGLNT